MLRLAMVSCVLVFFCLCVSAGQESRQSEPPSPDGKNVVLPTLLLAIGERCGCFFTMEEAWAEGESLNAMEAALVPKGLVNDTPQAAIARLNNIVPNFSYNIDSIDKRIVHIRDRRLLAIGRDYALDEIVGPLDFAGHPADLVRSIAARGVPITEKAFVTFTDPLDRDTVIHVKGARMSVRTALTDFLPFDTERKGKILWIARTKLEAGSKTSIHFPL
ncbi:MAG: hypothetical protein ACREDR_19830 [Blastocatellia bacterium]